ncbi:MAG: serine--tRNA ligase, partial [Candidatus Nitrosotenuis sp.]
MLDPKIIKEKPEIIRKMLSDRHVQFDLDLLVSLDSKRRELIIKTDELRKQKNKVAAEIASKKKTGQNADSVIAEMQKVSQGLQSLESEQIKTESDYSRLAMTLPNLIHESVPIGADESANVVVRSWGTIPKFDFKIKDHIDISQGLGLVDLERAAKTAGARFYYLRNELVRLNQ